MGEGTPASRIHLQSAPSVSPSAFFKRINSWSGWRHLTPLPRVSHLSVHMEELLSSMRLQPPRIKNIAIRYFFLYWWSLPDLNRDALPGNGFYLPLQLSLLRISIHTLWWSGLSLCRMCPALRHQPSSLYTLIGGLFEETILYRKTIGHIAPHRTVLIAML